MSVTFSTSPAAPLLAVELLCWESSATPIPSTPETATADIASHSASCAECRAYGGAIRQDVRVVDDVNLSNTNARLLLEALGFTDDELYGELNGELFLGRILLAEAVSPVDAGRPTVRTGNFVECGRDEGYLQHRLAQLRTLAEWAHLHGATITWG
jgi:hypothetical protein